MIGFFTVIELTGDEDAAGFKVQAKVKSQMNENILGILWLPPHLRQGQSNIDADSTVWGILDEISGIGCAMMGIGDADFGYFYDADIQVKKKLTVDGATALNDKLDVAKKATLSDALDVTKDIQSTSGDVKAGAISLKTHTHPITAAQFTGTIDPVTGSAMGTISGNTQVPQ